MSASEGTSTAPGQMAGPPEHTSEDPVYKTCLEFAVWWVSKHRPHIKHTGDPAKYKALVFKKWSQVYDWIWLKFPDEPRERVNKLLKTQYSRGDDKWEEDNLTDVVEQMGSEAEDPTGPVFETCKEIARHSLRGRFSHGAREANPKGYESALYRRACKIYYFAWFKCLGETEEGLNTFLRSEFPPAPQRN